MNKEEKIKRARLAQKRFREKHKEKLRLAHKEYFKKNPERVLAYKIKKYNLTPSQYNELFEKQGGRCLICKKHQSEISLALCVDHCHNKNVVRGLICSNCNRAIGLLGEDIDTMKSAIEYIQKGKSKQTPDESVG